MSQPSIPDLIARLISISDGNAQQAAARLGTTAASLSRWKTGSVRPRPQQVERLRALTNGTGDLVMMAEKPKHDARLERLEEAVSGTIHALREEFAMINLGLFGAKAANLKLANALAKHGAEGEFCKSIEGKVELILTNPPFGASFSGDDLNGFAMGHERNRAESEVLFLERYVDWLAPNGIVASVVPDSILVNRNAFADLRRWLYARCSIDAVFSLPPVTFGATGTRPRVAFDPALAPGEQLHGLFGGEFIHHSSFQGAFAVL